jgi:hypothetical protein
MSKEDTMTKELEGVSEAAIFAFLTRKYVQRADDRQRGMGLQYTEAETHDLARELHRFFAARSAPKVEVDLSDDRLIEACKSALLRLADEETDLRTAEQMREQAANLWSDDDEEDREAALRMFRYVLEALSHTGGGDE